MPVLIDRKTKAKEIAPGVFRKIVKLENLMTVVIDFTNGPMDKPEPPHHHPHEQTAYVAKGKLIVYIGDEEYELEEGDLYYVPSHVSHTIKTLTKEVRIIDNFTPIRKDFL